MNKEYRQSKIWKKCTRRVHYSRPLTDRYTLVKYSDPKIDSTDILPIVKKI